jgi:hypothetical protein
MKFTSLLEDLNDMEVKCLCEYVVIPGPIVFPVILWCLNVSTRFKTLKDLSAVAV